MRRRVYSITLPPQPAEPEYPEYDQVLAEAERSSRGPLDPQKPKEMEEVAARRGHDWCTGVIGRSFAGVAHIPCADGFMLLIADRLDLEPPVPRRIAEEKRAFNEQRDQDRARRAEERQQDLERWTLALASCLVKVDVRANLNRGGARGRLHATPDVAVRSNRGVHPAGQALCEAERTPRRLGDPIPDGVATCRSCVTYVAKIRPLVEG